MLVARVALPIPLPQLFDYTADDLSTADVGRCVEVPFGRSVRHGVIIAVSADSTLDRTRLKAVHHIQREVPALPAEWLALVEFAASYYHAPPGEVIALALPPELRRAAAVSADDADAWLCIAQAGHAALADGGRASRARALLTTIATTPELASGARRSAIRALADGEAVGELLRRGWLVEAPEQAPPPSTVPAEVPLPTAEQQATIAAIAASEGFQPWLLQGVTGSGKTEVYLQLAARTLAAGRQVLMLVPEIALTPQLEARVMARFPHAHVVSLHSRQADGARSRGFVQALAGRAQVVLGTRLAIFTPLPHLGLILVDEEHDPSYKQQEGVRYSARDLAVWRARQCAATVVLGSATPSLESWRHAREGRYRHAHLTQRAVAAQLPSVELVDVRHEKLDEGMGQAVKTALAAGLAAGEQSLLFLNRRGYAPVLACQACGWVCPCPNCSARLVVHLAERRLRCHHCGGDAAIPRACPVCGNVDIHAFGRGTQRIEERVQALFPSARVLRIDRDAARTHAQWQEMLARIGSGEVDILVGTQMMAKGHDFPALTRVCVLGADAALQAADVRAGERLFQQLMQVGGRAGRGTLPGRVLIQTAFPGHWLFPCVLRHDFDGFAAQELELRAQAGFPPFSHQAMLRADAPAYATAESFLRHARHLALELAPESVRVYDVVPMRLARLARRERGQLLIEADRRAPLQAFLGHWMRQLHALRTDRTLRWHLDVDPLEV